MKVQLSIKITLDLDERERILETYRAEGFKISARVLKLLREDVEAIRAMKDAIGI